MDETCLRCGELGQNRRTLWMSCFYDMMELGLPFERVAIHGMLQKWVRPEPLPAFPRVHAQIFEPIPDAKANRYDFFTLRVCKECRAEWMQAIASWFLGVKRGDSPGGDIPIREFGGVRTITQDEWERRNR